MRCSRRPFPSFSRSRSPSSPRPGQALLQRQFNRMVNAGDFAVSQAEELKDALDALTSNEFVMGDHHFSLQVIADDPQDALVTPPESWTLQDRIERQTKDLNDHVALARSLSC